MADDEQFTTETARAAAAKEELGDWVRRFLCSPGSDNADLADLLDQKPRWWIGPGEIPIDQLHRLAGPPGEPVVQELDEDDWRGDVDDLAEKIAGGLEPAPVIATKKDDHLMLEDGNHRVEAIRRSGTDTAWTIIAFPDPESRDAFIAESESVDG